MPNSYELYREQQRVAEQQARQTKPETEEEKKARAKREKKDKKKTKGLHKRAGKLKGSDTDEDDDKNQGSGYDAKEHARARQRESGSAIAVAGSGWKKDDKGNWVEDASRRYLDPQGARQTPMHGDAYTGEDENAKYRSNTVPMEARMRALGLQLPGTGQKLGTDDTLDHQYAHYFRGAEAKGNNVGGNADGKLVGPDGKLVHTIGASGEGTYLQKGADRHIFAMRNGQLRAIDAFGNRKSRLLSTAPPEKPQQPQTVADEQGKAPDPGLAQGGTQVAPTPSAPPPLAHEGAHAIAPEQATAPMPNPYAVPPNPYAVPPNPYAVLPNLHVPPTVEHEGTQAIPPERATAPMPNPYAVPPNPYAVPPNPYAPPPNPYAVPPNPYAPPPNPYAPPTEEHEGTQAIAPQQATAPMPNPYAPPPNPYAPPPLEHGDAHALAPKAPPPVNAPPPLHAVDAQEPDHTQAPGAHQTANVPTKADQSESSSFASDSTSSSSAAKGSHTRRSSSVTDRPEGPARVPGVSTDGKDHWALGWINHSSLFAGQDVESAGELEVEHGDVRRITNNSGHYLPDEQKLFQGAAGLADQGVNLAGTTATMVAAAGKKELNVGAHELLSYGGHEDARSSMQRERGKRKGFLDEIASKGNYTRKPGRGGNDGDGVVNDVGEHKQALREGTYDKKGEKGLTRRLYGNFKADDRSAPNLSMATDGQDGDEKSIFQMPPPRSAPKPGATEAQTPDEAMKPTGATEATEATEPIKATSGPVPQTPQQRLLDEIARHHGGEGNASAGLKKVAEGEKRDRSGANLSMAKGKSQARKSISERVAKLHKRSKKKGSAVPGKSADHVDKRKAGASIAERLALLKAGGLKT